MRREYPMARKSKDNGILADARGFTLVEVLIVLLIIGIMAVLVVPRLTGRTESARRTAAQVDIQANIALALDLYELDNGAYPTTEQGLQALLTEPASAPVPPDWKGPYLKKREQPKDPWKNPYVYAYPGQHNPGGYDLYSRGPDGAEGGGDDITNWTSEDQAKQ